MMAMETSPLNHSTFRYSAQLSWTGAWGQSGMNVTERWMDTYINLYIAVGSRVCDCDNECFTSQWSQDLGILQYLFVYPLIFLSGCLTVWLSLHCLSVRLLSKWISFCQCSVSILQNKFICFPSQKLQMTQLDLSFWFYLELKTKGQWRKDFKE